jgi:hypothetical protein
MQAFVNFGALTEDIVFQRKTEAGAWNDYVATRAELIPEYGGEVMKAESTRPSVRVKFRLRFLSLLKGIDTREIRLTHGDDTYNVMYIEDDRNRHVTMYAVCEREDR